VPRFANKNKRMLEVNISGDKVLALAGSMVAYEGSVKFEKAILGGGGGIFGALKRAATGEGIPLMACTGNGVVFFAKDAHDVNVLEIAGNKLFVESSSLLAYDPALKTDVAFKGLRGMTSGQGLFTTSVDGRGSVALLSHGPLIPLEVSPQYPLCVDPDAFVAYQGNLQQEFIFDVNWKNFIGQGSGESFQFKFSGTGVVYIQPAERK
jgi:uncharacterized protein (AIM24 family)